MKSFLKYLGFILIPIAALMIGEFHGRKTAERTLGQNITYQIIARDVGLYNAIANNDTDKAKRICGQDLWASLDFYDQLFAGETPPAWFPKKLPEARRIVGVVSNEDWHKLHDNLDPQAARILRQAFGTNFPSSNDGK